MLVNSSDPQIWCPYIQTEETICRLLIRDKNQLSDEFELMPYPLAHWINTIGVEKTNERIKSLKSNRTRIFVCQHILVDKLAFQDNDIVCTCHSSNPKFISIPHYAVNCNPDLKIERKYEFSFLGSTKTHIVRRKLVERFPNNCFDSKAKWRLDFSLPEDFRNRYIQMMGQTKFSLCPRGTGIGSVRLFESMAMGCVPVIIADGYIQPLSQKLDWNKFSISVDESLVEDIPKIIKQYDFDSMGKEVCRIYNKYFSNDTLHTSIMESLA